MQVQVMERTNAGETGIRIRRGIEAVLLLVAAVSLCLHWVHLRADFPNHSPWMDWAKYTDEGWYGDGAIRHFGRGSWYVAGDFNPAVALPVWPLVEAAVFRFTGVGIGPARALSVAVFGLTLVCAYVLLRRGRGVGTTVPLAAATGVLLLAVSPFCYAFTRLAILEPMLNLVMMVVLAVANELRPAQTGVTGVGTARRQTWLLLMLGVLLPILVLTKTTGVFLFPAVLWMVWARLGFGVRSGLRAAAVIAGVGLGLWAAYYGLVVRPHFLEDYRYLFSANGYTGITSDNMIRVLRDTVLDGGWIGRVIYPLSLVAAVVAVLWWWKFLADPLIASLVLWAGGYTVFLAYHANLQPRYYLVVAVPLTLLVPLVLERAWKEAATDRAAWQWVWRSLAVVGAGVLAIVAMRDASMTLRYVREPEYTFVEAAEQIQRIVRADTGHSPLLLSISGSDLSLMTGLPSICDDYGTLELGDRVTRYRPGWYVSWNQVDDDKMDALAPMYHLERVAAFPAMDDRDRNLLILYRLDAGASAKRPRGRKRRPLPRVLVTKMGQQPSVMQLEH